MTSPTWQQALISAQRSKACGDHIWISLREPTQIEREVSQSDPSATQSLAGIPFGAKDNFFSADLPTSAGSPVLAQLRTGSDAPCIAALRTAGAVLIGKTNMHELGLGVTSENGAFGTVRNPVAPGYVAGGSSGGSAAAVAAGHVPFALASDTGGSARLPAAFCGVVGFRPSTGRWSTQGIVPLSSLRDTPGVIASSIDWVQRVDKILAVTGARARANAGATATSAATSNAATSNATTSSAVTNPRSTIDNGAVIRLGIHRRFYCDPIHDAIADSFARTVTVLAEDGFEFVELDIPNLAELDAQIGFTVALYEAAQLLPQFCRTFSIDFARLVAQSGSADVAEILPQLQAQSVPLAAYRAAIDQALPRLRAAYDATLASHDIAALIVPTCPVPVPMAKGLRTVSIGNQELPLFPTVSRNTSPASLLGTPSISLPMLVAAGQLPTGLMLDGWRDADVQLLTIANRVQASLRAHSGARGHHIS